jgi:hypothetical protein
MVAPKCRLVGELDIGHQEIYPLASLMMAIAAAPVTASHTVARFAPQAADQVLT